MSGVCVCTNAMTQNLLSRITIEPGKCGGKPCIRGKADRSRRSSDRMKFIVDNQLPLLLAIHLRQWGHDCKPVPDVGLDEVDDAAVWASAIREDRVVVSKDEDFVYLSTRPGNSALLAAFDRVRNELIQALESGRRIVEVG